jgi:hypothetical protein
MAKGVLSALSYCKSRKLPHGDVSGPRILVKNGKYMISPVYPVIKYMYKNVS